MDHLSYLSTIDSKRREQSYLKSFYQRFIIEDVVKISLQHILLVLWEPEYHPVYYIISLSSILVTNMWLCNVWFDVYFLYWQYHFTHYVMCILPQ